MQYIRFIINLYFNNLKNALVIHFSTLTVNAHTISNPMDVIFKKSLSLMKCNFALLSHDFSFVH
jgi:hypothetical protein